MTCVAQKRLCLRELSILVSAEGTAAMLVDLTTTKVSFPPLGSEINSSFFLTQIVRKKFYCLVSQRGCLVTSLQNKEYKVKIRPF